MILSILNSTAFSAKILKVSNNNRRVVKMNSIICHVFFAVSLVISLFLFGPVSWAADSTSLMPQNVTHLTYICETTSASYQSYRSKEWDCDHMDQAHSCREDDVVTGLFSRWGLIYTKFPAFHGWICSYLCARVRPECRWIDPTKPRDPTKLSLSAQHHQHGVRFPPPAPNKP